MQITEDNISEFVRDNTVSKIEKRINSGDSIKLVALPKMGTTSIMQYIAYQANKRKEMFKDFLCIYISGRYKPNEVKKLVSEQLSKRYSKIEYDNFEFYISRVYEKLKYKNPGKVFIFLLDDFQANFKKYSGSTLDQSSLTQIRHLSEQKDLFFIVSYKFPIQIDIKDDWYLNNFYRINIEMLNKAEAKKLIKLIRYNKNLEFNDDIFNKIYYYTGGHPDLINDIAKENISHQDIWLQRKVINRYTQIYTYILNKGEELFNDNSSYIKTLFENIKNYDEKKIPSFISQYFITNSDNRKVIFSEFFKTWIENKPYPNPQDKKSSNFQESNRNKLFRGITLSVILIIITLVGVTIALKMFGITTLTIFILLVFTVFIFYLIILAVIAPRELSSLDFIKASKLLFSSMGKYIEKTLSIYNGKKNKNNK